MLPEKPFRGGKVGAVEHDQRTAHIRATGQVGGIDSALKAGPVKGKISAKFLELPAECRREKGACRGRVGGCEFDIVDLVMTQCPAPM